MQFTIYVRNTTYFIESA